MYNVNAVSASTTIAMSRCSLTQLGSHLRPGELGFAPVWIKTAYQEHIGSLDCVILTGDDRDASFSFDIVVWKLPMRSWDPSPS